MKFLIYLLYRNFSFLYKITPNFILKKIKFSILFTKCRINFNDLGFWYITPLPEASILENYYNKIYWDSIPMCEGVNTRDIDHYLFIRDAISSIKDKKPITFLNFGSGGGGISHLLYLDGHKIINVEPKILLHNHTNNWVNITSIEKVGEKVDFIYSCHSLNVVLDVKHTLYLMNEILKPQGYIFIEVPNANKLIVQNCEHPKISLPQTYYFQETYFKNLHFKRLLLGTFNNTFPSTLDENGNGLVIRFLGQKEKN